MSFRLLLAICETAGRICQEVSLGSEDRPLTAFDKHRHAGIEIGEAEDIADQAGRGEAHIQTSHPSLSRRARI